MKISIIRIIQYFALKFIPCKHCIWKITKQNPRVLCPKSSTPTVNVPLQPQIETRTQLFICIINHMDWEDTPLGFDLQQLNKINKSSKVLNLFKYHVT